MTATLSRALLFLVLWLAVAGTKLADLPVGIVVAAAAAWISLRLAPPSGAHINFRAAPIFFLHFLGASLSSGLDVARRALAATPDLRPGMVKARLTLAPGFARNVFCIIANLMPGTLLTGLDADDPQTIYVHGLDIGQPIAADLAGEEAAFKRTLGHD